MGRKKYWGFLVFVFLSLLSASSAISQYDESNRCETLRGIKGIYVVVSTNTESEKFGLTSSLIQTDVELKLRLAGIKVPSQEEFMRIHGEPFLIVDVMVLRRGCVPTGTTYFGGISTHAHQLVKLVRNPEITVSTVTWETGYYMASSNIDDFRNKVKDQVDEFINAYLSVNPKK